MARATVPVAIALAGTVLLGLGGGAVDPPTRSSGVPSITVTGISASIVYVARPRLGGGPIPPGTRSAVVSFSPTIRATAPIRVSITGTGFVGPVALPADTRKLRLSTGQGGLMRSAAATGRWTRTSVVAGWNPVYRSTRSVHRGTFTLDLRVDVPLDATPGSYAGALELTFATQAFSVAAASPSPEASSAPEVSPSSAPMPTPVLPTPAPPRPAPSPTPAPSLPPVSRSDRTPAPASPAPQEGGASVPPAPTPDPPDP